LIQKPIKLYPLLPKNSRIIKASIQNEKIPTIRKVGKTDRESSPQRSLPKRAHSRTFEFFFSQQQKRANEFFWNFLFWLSGGSPGKNLPASNSKKPFSGQQLP
jgi:hypothetical protein